MPCLPKPKKTDGRLALAAPEDLTGVQEKVYDLIVAEMVPWAEESGFRSQTSDGKLIGPFNAFPRSLEITASFRDWESVEEGHTTLTERERQVVILAVGDVWEADYERYAHAAVARKAGIPEAAIRALVSGITAGDLSDKKQIAERFTRQLATENHVDEESYRETEGAFGPRGIVDVIYLAGHYMTISSLLNVFQVPVPE